MSSAVKDRLGILKIHLPLDRPATRIRRSSCIAVVKHHANRLIDDATTAVLITDHNTHGRLPSWGGRVLYQHGFDYIGAMPAIEGAQIEVLRHKRVPGSIDNHDYIGVRVRVTWPSGRKTKLWLVQANLGRGATYEAVRLDLLRIKGAFTGNFVIGFDEVDELDGPNEHEMIEKTWNSKHCTFAAFDTLSPVIVSRRLRVESDTTIRACPGLEHITPHRDLNEIVINPPKRRFRKDKS